MSRAFVCERRRGTSRVACRRTRSRRSVRTRDEATDAQRARHCSNNHAARAATIFVAAASEESRAHEHSQFKFEEKSVMSVRSCRIALHARSLVGRQLRRQRAAFVARWPVRDGRARPRTVDEIADQASTPSDTPISICRIRRTRELYARLERAAEVGLRQPMRRANLSRTRCARVRYEALVERSGASRQCER